MGKVIANTYELLREIGSGGGGVVYLGRHLNLDKQIVLKADKRSLSAGAERLRQEVDALKNLTHSYIPTVYDYVQEDGIVYTVMDYIEGDSLEHIIRHGEKIPQKQVVEWACELLEAICYLHSRPPYGILHADIKPANVMITPNGEVRLIDYNIALALGEDGAVLTGYSAGYASPEHYGLDYSDAADMVEPGGTGTVLDTSADASTVRETVSSRGSSKVSKPRRKKGKLLDVRSDIYCLGATLYHVLTGEVPNRDALRVTPISHWQDISLPIQQIISKAMQPNPDRRYQTAADMLHDFEHLRDLDPRTRHWKRTRNIVAAVLAFCFLAGGGTAFAGQRIRTAEEQTAREAAERAEEQERIAKEAENAAKTAIDRISTSREAMDAGNLPLAISAALEATELDTPYNSQARYALTDALGVYDLATGFKAERIIPLESVPLKAGLSPGGGRVYAITSGKVSVYATYSGELLAQREMEKSVYSDAVFAGENIIIYAGSEGITAWDLSDGRQLWQGGKATSLALSADGRRVAGVYLENNEAYVYDTANGSVVNIISFGGDHQVAPEISVADRETNLFCLNGDGTQLASSFNGGNIGVFEVNTGKRILDIPVNYSSYTGGYCGDTLAYSGYSARGDEISSELRLVNPYEPERSIMAAASSRMRVQADESGIYFGGGNSLSRIDLDTLEMTRVAHTASSTTIQSFSADGEYRVVCGADGSYFFYYQDDLALSQSQSTELFDFAQIAGGRALLGSRAKAALRILLLNNHMNAEAFAYDPSLRHDEARFSADGRTVMLFSFDHFDILNMDGTLIKEIELPDSEQVYDQQFRRDGSDSWLEVTYTDGRVENYSARDGSVISTRQIDTPDPSLEQDFFTERLRIHFRLNQPAMAYDRETGEFLRELERDVNLIYVTQIGEYTLTEYYDSSGNTMSRFGLLLDENLDTVAKLPDICDVIGDTVYFDYDTGDIRCCTVYSEAELRELALDLLS